MKLNLGCGFDKRKGYLNCDILKVAKPDMIVDLEKKLPFKDNTFDYIFTSHTLEHIRNIYPLMDELFRISKPNAIINIIVPHFTSITSKKYFCHLQDFGIDTFAEYEPEDRKHFERYSHSRFKVLKQELIFVAHDFQRKSFRPFTYLNVFNPLFNLNKFTQIFSERCFPFGFDGIKYKLQVYKQGAESEL